MEEEVKPSVGGRPTDYKQEYCEQVKKLCLLGAIDTEIADFFGVCEKTVNNWKKEHPEFLQSIKEGKVVADAEVASALYNRAIGYSHKEDKIFNHQGEPLVVPTEKHYPPDPTSIAIWLNNRQGAKWKQKQEQEQGEDLAAALMALAEKLPT